MKIGLVLECTNEGPDMQVYRYLARHLLGENVDLQFSCCTNKATLVREAGTRARALIAEDCERVLFIWDLWPAWGDRDTQPSLIDDCNNIDDALRTASVENACVYLICINRMLETLLITDGGAIADVLEIPLGKQRPGNQRNARAEPDPKGYLDRWFRRYRKGPYTDYRHAIKIAKSIRHDRATRGCPEYTRFCEALVENPCKPPLAWQP